MATLGELRQYASDAAYQISGVAADRSTLRWIQQALQNLWSAHPWVHFYAEEHIVSDVEVTGTDLTVTAGSAAVSRGSAWTAAFVTQAWDLIISGSDVVFHVESIGTPTTNATLDAEWAGSSGVNQSYTVRRARYALPGNFAKRLLVVEDVDTKVILEYKHPAQFAPMKCSSPANSGAPYYFTLRGLPSGPGLLEVYPAPDSTRRTLKLTYVRKVTLPASSDVAAFVLDWPDEYVELLQKRVEVEAARLGGEQAQVAYPVARAEFDLALTRYMALDSQLARKSGSMTLAAGMMPTPRTTVPWSGRDGTYT